MVHERYIQLNTKLKNQIKLINTIYKKFDKLPEMPEKNEQFDVEIDKKDYINVIGNISKNLIKQNIHLQSLQTQQSSNINIVKNSQGIQLPSTTNKEEYNLLKNNYLLNSAQEISTFFKNKTNKPSILTVNKIKKQIIYEQLKKNSKKIQFLTQLNKNLQNKIQLIQKQKSLFIIENRLKLQLMNPSLKINENKKQLLKGSRKSIDIPLVISRYVRQKQQNDQDQINQQLDQNQNKQNSKEYSKIKQRSDQVNEYIIYEILTHQNFNKKLSPFIQVGFKGLKFKKNIISYQAPLMRRQHLSNKMLTKKKKYSL